MPKKRFSAEQVVTLLRQIQVLIAQGKSAPVACREAGISQQNSAMICSTAKSSTASRRRRSSSSNGASATTRYRPHSAIGYGPPAPQTINPFLTPLDQAVQMQ